jgi:hypothetical protein
MILADELITHCYIHKGSGYKPHSSGYTDVRCTVLAFMRKKEAKVLALNVDNIAYQLDILNIMKFDK